MADRDFEVKTFDTIRQEMVDELVNQQAGLPAGKKKLTDFSFGSLISTIVRAIAAVIAGYWRYLAELTDSFYIETATGERLKRRFRDFGFEMKTGSKAIGTVQVIRPVGELFTGSVNVGDRLAWGSLAFAVTKASPALGPVGTKAVSVSIDVMAEQNGSKGNLPANTQLVALDSRQNGLRFLVGTALDEAKSNATDGGLSGGLNDETAEEARVRFKSYIQNLGKGTVDIIQNEVNNVPGVRRSKVYDNSRVIGGAIDGPATTEGARTYPGYIVVQVQPSDPTSGLSESLKAAISTAIEGTKAAGIAYQLHSVPVKEIDVEVTVKTRLTVPSADWTSYTTKLTDVVQAKFNALDLKEALYVWVLQSDLLVLDRDKAPGGITLVCRDTVGNRVDDGGKVVPEQTGDGGVLALRNLTFVAEAI